QCDETAGDPDGDEHPFGADIAGNDRGRPEYTHAYDQPHQDGDCIENRQHALRPVLLAVGHGHPRRSIGWAADGFVRRWAYPGCLPSCRADAMRIDGVFRSPFSTNLLEPRQCDQPMFVADCYAESTAGLTSEKAARLAAQWLRAGKGWPAHHSRSCM